MVVEKLSDTGSASQQIHMDMDKELSMIAKDWTLIHQSVILTAVQVSFSLKAFHYNVMFNVTKNIFYV